MNDPRLTYCGNVHAADDLDAWLSAVDEFSVPIAEALRAEGQSFGLGAWWNAQVCAELSADASAQARVSDVLAARDLKVWTLNVFPFGGFHDSSVKTAVYEPDWGSEERLLYTRQAAELAALWSPEGSVVPLSTLPLGYRSGRVLDAAGKRVMARNLVRAASHLADLSARTGRDFVLALEPEPFCLLETVAETADFLEEWLFSPGSWTVPAETLRRHLGLCVDLCHLAVVGEDALAWLAALQKRGIRVPKIQVSSGLELRDPSALDQLLAFDEQRYLHQTFGAGGLRALDLCEVAGRRAEFAASDRVRTHFHLPVFWDAEGPLGSTRAELEMVLGGLGTERPLLEVETYTWSVLDSSWRPDRDLVAGILQELAWVSARIDA